jgi:hypothetical protein
VKVYLAYIDWPYGIEPIGIFSSEAKARQYFNEGYVGVSYSSVGKYTKDMLQVEERQLDPQ